MFEACNDVGVDDEEFLSTCDLFTFASSKAAKMFLTLVCSDCRVVLREAHVSVPIGHLFDTSEDADLVRFLNSATTPL